MKKLQFLHRIFPFVLLAALCMPVCSTYFYFKQRQYQIKKAIKRQIKKGVNDEDLVLLKIAKVLENTSNEDFERIHSKEFRYKGEMYDIVRFEDRGSETWYWCIWDREETALFAALPELLKRAWSQDPMQEQTTERVMLFFKSLFWEYNHIIPLADMCLSKKNEADYNKQPIRRIIPPEVPPPKMLLNLCRRVYTA